MKFNFSIDGKEYEKMLGSFHKYYIKVKCKELLKFLKEIDYHPQVVLDLGCGTGEVEEILYRFFNKIVGIDLSEDMLREANTKRIPNCKFEKANILKLPFKNNSFDLVFSFCAFHHLLKNERYSALKEATRVTKINGIIAIFEHNPRNIITQYVVKKSPVDKGVVLIKLEELRNLFKVNGLMILKEGFFLYSSQYMIAGRKE